MKKLFLGVVAFAAMIFASSCQQEKMEQPAAQENTVTLAVELPAEMTKTKAIGDNPDVEELIYEVWRTGDDGKITENSTRLYQKTLNLADGQERNRWIVTLNLVQNQTYKILFWAQDAEADVYNTANLTAVTYSDKRNVFSNKENYEAFYKSIILSTDEPLKGQTIVLTRPFAQLNIGTLNTADASEYSIELVSSKVKVTVPTIFNVETSAVSEPVEMIFKDADVLDATLSVSNTAYQYVAMNYVFAGKRGENGAYTSNVEYTIQTKVTPTAANSSVTDATVHKVIPSVPFEENFRTNIIGNLLTTSAQYEVVVDARFNEPAKDIRTVTNTDELAIAVAEAKSGETIYIDGEVTMPYFTNKALNFVGVKKSAIVKQSPATHVDKYYEGAELNFSNLTLVGTSYTNDSQGYQKSVKETYNKCHFVNYIMFAGDVTEVTDCTFKNEGQYFWTGSADMITFNNCKFEGKERAVKVCTVGNAGERKVTFNNCKFSAQNQVKAAIEIDGSKGSSYIVKINNCTENGFAAGEFTGETMFNIEGQDNVTVFIDGNKWVSTGAVENEQGTKIYTNTAGLLSAIAAAQSGDVLLLGDAEFDGVFHVGTKSLTLKAADNCKPEVAGRVSFAGSTETTLTLENIKFSVSENTNQAIGNTYYDKYKGYIVGNYAGNLNIKNCQFVGMTDEFGAIYYYSHTGGTSNDKLEKLTVEGCTFDGGRAIRSRANVSVKNSSFSGLVENNPCLQIIGFGEDHLAGNVEFTGNRSTASASGVCLKTGNQPIKNVTFNVSGNTKCNYISFDGKNTSNLFLDTFAYTGDVKTINPEDAQGLNYLLEKNVAKIELLPGATYEGTFHVITSNKEIASADANNKAMIKGRVHVNSVNATFTNVEFDRNDTNSNEPNNTASNALQYKAVVMIYGDQTHTIKFEGCNFYKNNGTHKSAITNVACNLIVNNCYFEGTSSSIYSQANLSVTNSTFNYTGGNNVILSLNGCGESGGKVIFKNNVITNKIFALSQFLSTVGFGNGAYYFDVQGNTGAGFDYFFLNENRVTNKTFADGSVTF